MILITINRCSFCNDYVKPKVSMINGEIAMSNLCKFCQGREDKIKKIKQKITHLEYELFKMRDQKF